MATPLPRPLYQHVPCKHLLVLAFACFFATAFLFLGIHSIEAANINFTGTLSAITDFPLKNLKVCTYLWMELLGIKAQHSDPTV